MGLKKHWVAGAWFILGLAPLAAMAIGRQPESIQTRLNESVTGLRRVTTAVPSSNPFVTLAAHAGVPMGVEAVPAPRRDPRLRTRGPMSALTLSPGTFADMLHQVQAGVPGYDVVIGDDLISVAPVGMLQSSADFLNQTIADFDVEQQTPMDVVRTLRRLMNPSYAKGPGSLRRRPGPPGAMGQLVTIKLLNASPREILNRLVTLDPGLVWLAWYESPVVGQTPAVSDENCVLTLVPFTGGGVAESFPPSRRN